MRLAIEGLDGWASKVVILCWTFSNGSFVSFSMMALVPRIGDPSKLNIDESLYKDTKLAEFESKVL